MKPPGSASASASPSRCRAGSVSPCAWLVRALPRPDRSSVKALDPGPLEDLRAMSARYERSSKTVREAARGVYDEYLRANRVPEGIGSYDAVVRLMVGTRFTAPGTPALR